MAQILKDKCRERIIKAAREEFHQKGYKAASLRRIASNAGMTVGNLYRYYKNKEDLNKQIVASTLDKIEDTLNSLTNNKISIETHVFDTKMSTSQLFDALDGFSEKMVDIYDETSDEFEIVMLHSKLNERFINWFFNIVLILIKQNYNPKDPLINIEKMAETYSIAIWSGVKNIIINSNEIADNKKFMLKFYFRTYVYMLDSDLAKIISAI